MKEKGYTLAEVIIVISIIGVITMIGTTLYVGSHFITKFW